MGSSSDPPRAARLAVALAGALAGLGACSGAGLLRPELQAPVDRQDALAVHDAMEALIDRERDTPEDRRAAYEAVRRWREPTAAYAYARAALAGRLVQALGLAGASYIEEIERYGQQSAKLDPSFRDGAAKRTLGTMYVLAPASLVKQGDSEQGLEMLEELAAQHPAEMENHLRLAEGYIALGDPDPAREPLCRCLAAQRRLRPDSRRLMHRLVRSGGGRAALRCK
ncbi:MAG: hypothetical protein HY744_17805 [Deltaproteobacteria bacterium]|nr:hypothetical protein [Deltaproteobacteria bacterium]